MMKACASVWALLLLTVTACTGLPVKDHPSTKVDQGVPPYNDPGSPGLVWLGLHQDDPRAPLLNNRLGYRDDGSYVPAIPVVLADSQVVSTIGGVVVDAARINRIPMFVLHPGAVPVGDCQTPRDFAAVAAEVSRSVGDDRAVLVLMSQAIEQHRCGAPAAHVQQAIEIDRQVIEALSRGEKTALLIGVGPVVGLTVDEASGLIAEVGLDGVDGVAVDIGGYATRDDKETWAQSLREELGFTGDGDFVTAWDSGRIGTDASSQVDACNPDEAYSGETRRVGPLGKPLRLWLTPPGLSDGLCGLAPDTPAGQFSPDIAWNLFGLTEDDLTPQGLA